LRSRLTVLAGNGTPPVKGVNWRGDHRVRAQGDGHRAPLVSPPKGKFKGNGMRIWNSRLKQHVEWSDEACLRALKKQLCYDPQTGHWFRRADGTRFDRRESDGYYSVRFAGKKYRVQCLAYFYMTGVWPAALVDHKDRDRSNNTWSNFRLASRAQNAANSKLRKDNKSGLKGVHWNKEKGCWTAQIRRLKKTTTLAHSECRAAAHFAYLIAADQLYGEFARAR
jgi:hypothetical protein